jgi:hypothetical protein
MRPCYRFSDRRQTETAAEETDDDICISGRPGITGVHGVSMLPGGLILQVLLAVHYLRYSQCLRTSSILLLAGGEHTPHRNRTVFSLNLRCLK